MKPVGNWFSREPGISRVKKITQLICLIFLTRKNMPPPKDRGLRGGQVGIFLPSGLICAGGYVAAFTRPIGMEVFVIGGINTFVGV